MFKAIQSDVLAKEGLIEEKIRKSLGALMAWKVPLTFRYLSPDFFRAVSYWRDAGEFPPDLLRTAKLFMRETLKGERKPIHKNQIRR